MTNLLEQTDITVRRRELWARSLVLILVCASALALASLALAVSVYATVYVDAQADQSALSRIQTAATQGNARTRRAEIANLHTRVQEILAASKAGTRTEELSFIGGVQSPGISIRGIQIDRVGDKPSRITLALSAKERTQLLTFIDLLRGNTQVARVEYPTSALVKSSDISTTISFSYTQASTQATSTASTTQKTP